MQTSGESGALLLRLWDYFLVNGWKGIFKASVAILKENEEALLGMPFEVMLTQVVNLPTKYFICDHKGDKESEQRALDKFDKQMKQIKVSTMLLERLKREFDLNFKLSGVIQSTSSSSSISPDKPRGGR